MILLFGANHSRSVQKNQLSANPSIHVFPLHVVSFSLPNFKQVIMVNGLLLLLGPNSKCQVVSNQAQCGCQDGMIGSVPNCRPECIRNSDCPSNLACINQKCKDPCSGVCGANTQCRVVGHNPVCSCKESFTGDPFRNCVPIQRKD